MCRLVHARLGTASRARFTLFGLRRRSPGRIKPTAAGGYGGSVQRNAISEYSNYQNWEYQKLAGRFRRQTSHGRIPSRPRRQPGLNLGEATRETGTVKYQQSDPSGKQDPTNPPHESWRWLTNKESRQRGAIEQSHSNRRETPR